MDSDALARSADRALAFAWAVLGRNRGFPVVAGPSMTLFASGMTHRRLVVAGMDSFRR